MGLLNESKLGETYATSFLPGKVHNFMWEQIILTAVMGVLAGLKKSPQDVPKFKTVLVHIVTDVCELLGVQPPVIYP